MKKQFFYAAMAVALMASCTSEDNLSVDPIIPDEDDKVAIQLGIDAPTVNATVGRAVGSVGDVEPEQGQVNKNVWNGQQLYITMVDKDGSVVMNGSSPVLGYNNYKYFAPRGEGATDDELNLNTNSGDIRIYAGDNNPAAGGNGQGTLSYVYYPVSGQYDFYGYHVDDAQNVVNTNPTKITGITITGQQDIMGARTKEFTAANYFGGDTDKYAELVGWDFSARTARNNIKPILKFEHQLARLKFFVKAGSDKTAEYKYDGSSSSWVKNIATGSADVSTAMKVQSIKAKNMVNKIDMNLNDNGKIVTGISGAGASYATDGFSLLSRDENGTMKNDLDEVAPLVYDGTGTAADNSEVVPASNGQAAITYADYKNGTQVGESIMFFPYDGGAGKNTKQTVELEMVLAQWVQVLDDEADDDYDATEWEEKTQTANLKIHASSVKNATGGLVEAFEPGKSYNVYITVYGFEKIEITAELTAWENGGDVNVDVEEGESRHDVDVTFYVQDEDSEAISDAVITATYSYKNNAGVTVPGQTATFTAGDEAGSWVATVPSFAVLNYTITADGYEPATGYANAKNGNDVTITMKAAGTAPAPEEQPFEVTFNYVLSDMTPVEVADDAITITSPANCTVSNGKVTVPAGTTEIIYSIAETDLYDAIPESHATVSTETPNVHVTMTPKAQAPAKRTFTIDVTNESEFSFEFDLVVKEAGEGGATVEPIEENGREFELEVGKSYVISISGKASEDGEVKTATKTIDEVTAEMEDTITIAFPTEEGGGI